VKLHGKITSSPSTARPKGFTLTITLQEGRHQPSLHPPAAHAFELLTAYLRLGRFRCGADDGFARCGYGGIVDAMRYPRGNGIGVPIDVEPQMIEIGKAELLRDGGEIAIVAYGSMVHPSLQAAENLAKDGIEATVINARFVKPLDSGLLLALARTKRLIVTVEEAYLAGGFGSAVIELLEENGLQDKVRVVRMGVPDRIVTHGDPKLLLAKYGLDADGIYTRVKEAVEVLEDRRAKHQKVTA